MPAHVHPLHVYYEDTDFSGVVYHANYLKFMERAREHLLGIDELVRRWKEERLGFVVYKADLTFREPAVHGDRLEVHTTVSLPSKVRLVCDQRVRRAGGRKDLVTGRIELVAVTGEGRLADLPADVHAILARYGEP